MVNGIRVKVCGLTSFSDAEEADAAGADYLGFILYPKSPRAIPLEQFKAMRGRLPPRKTVAVLVEPSLTEVGQAVAAGFHTLQIHFSVERTEEFAPRWVECVDAERLWLAPRTRDLAQLPRSLVDGPAGLLLDAFAADKFGGTGQTGDWKGFAELRRSHPAKRFILSGGLSPANVAEALGVTRARWLDVNSGVETSPGIKDPAKVREFFAAVRAASTRAASPPAGQGDDSATEPGSDRPRNR